MIQQNRKKKKKKKKKKMSHIKRKNMFKERERLRVDGIENGVLIQYTLSNRKSRSSALNQRVCWCWCRGKKRVKEKRVKPHVDGVL